MSDWPTDTTNLAAMGTLCTLGEDSPVGDLSSALNGNLGSGSWNIGANLGVFVPILVRSQTTVYKMVWQNGTVVSGNLDVGIYDSERNRLVSLGSTAQSGVSSVQVGDIADTTLAPGLYYFAMTVDNQATATYQRSSVSNSVLITSGMAQMASAFPLPATATFTRFGFTYIPYIAGITQSSVF